MLRLFVLGLVAFAAVATGLMHPASAETRIALVIGNANYVKGGIRTALADGGLVAEALNSSGFEIVEGADLNQADLRRTFRDFLAKVEAAGPDAIAFVYFAGYGLAFEGENYLIPVDVRLDRDSDIPLDAVRVSDLMRPLAALPAKAKLVVLDATRPHPFALRGLATGLVPIDAPPGLLVGYASAPGMVAEDGNDAYGPYARAVAEMIRDPALDADAAFARIRVRTHQATEGRQTPWHVSALTGPIHLVPGGGPPTVMAPAPGPSAAPPRAARRPVRAMRDIEMEEAYALAIEQDTLASYVEFVEVYPRSPHAPRIWSILRARREAMAWMRALEFNTPEAYWTYLRRYPRGLYAEDARRRLRRLAVMLEPPPSFAPVEFYDVPPPLPQEPPEVVFVYSAPPPPVRIIEPPPVYFVTLPPPPPPSGPRFLPVPVPMAVTAPHIKRPPRVNAVTSTPVSLPPSSGPGPTPSVVSPPQPPQSVTTTTPPAGRVAPPTAPGTTSPLPSATVTPPPPSTAVTAPTPSGTGVTTPPAATVTSTPPAGAAVTATPPAGTPPPGGPKGPAGTTVTPTPPAGAAVTTTPPTGARTPAPSLPQGPVPTVARTPPAGAVGPTTPGVGSPPGAPKGPPAATATTPPPGATPPPPGAPKGLPRPTVTGTPPTGTPGVTPPTTRSAPPTQPGQPAPAQATRGAPPPPPQATRSAPPPPPQATRSAPPPPPQATRPAAPPPPPPQAARPVAPPPPQAARPAAPPPPPQAARPVAPPPPPQAARPAAPPPPQAQRPTPPPQAARGAPPAAQSKQGKKCEVVNGVEVCK